MAEAQLKAEKNYQAVRDIAELCLVWGLVSFSEFMLIDDLFQKRFHPKVRKLFSDFWRMWSRAIETGRH